MLNAFLHGKKRGTGAEGEDLGASFSGAEDTLTATFFERLLYLRDEVVATILLGVFGETPEDAAIEDVLFWPRWERPDSPGFKEPDLVIEWSKPDGILVIEAKRTDFVEKQDAGQLAEEWKAARTQYPDRGIWLLAVGGIQDSREATVKKLHEDIIQRIGDGDLRFKAMMWHEVFLRLEESLGESPPRHVQRLADDIREGMVLHGVGVARPAWLSDLLEPPWSDLLGLREEEGLRWFASRRAPCNLWDLAGFGPIRSSPDDLSLAMGGKP